jgi:hypothetical protein
MFILVLKFFLPLLTILHLQLLHTPHSLSISSSLLFITSPFMNYCLLLQTQIPHSSFLFTFRLSLSISLHPLFHLHFSLLFIILSLLLYSFYLALLYFHLILKYFYLLGHNTVQSVESQPTFRRHLVAYFTSVYYFAYDSTLKMEATCPSGTSVDTQQTTRRYIPEGATLHNHRCNNLKSSILFLLSSFISPSSSSHSIFLLFFPFCTFFLLRP